MKWWEKLYDENLAAILLNPAVGEELEGTRRFLTKVLKLDGSTIFDQCCGNGRVSHELAKAGHTVFGVDQAEIYITLAQREQNENAHFSVGDAFQYLPPESCDAAFNWWTSFGYDPSDEVNVKMLERAYDSLKSGGRFALDYMNVPNIYHAFKKDVITRQPVEGGELLLWRESSIDVPNEALLKTWTYLLPDGRKVVHESHTRLYSPMKLKELFQQAGFTEIAFYGDLDESPLTLNSPRCIITGEKR